MTGPAGPARVAVTDGTCIKGTDDVPRRYRGTAFILPSPVALCLRASLPRAASRQTSVSGLGKGLSTEPLARPLLFFSRSLPWRGFLAYSS